MLWKCKYSVFPNQKLRNLDFPFPDWRGVGGTCTLYRQYTCAVESKHTWFDVPLSRNLIFKYTVFWWKKKYLGFKAWKHNTNVLDS